MTTGLYLQLAEYPHKETGNNAMALLRAPWLTDNYNSCVYITLKGMLNEHIKLCLYTVTPFGIALPPTARLTQNKMTYWNILCNFIAGTNIPSCIDRNYTPVLICVLLPRSLTSVCIWPIVNVGCYLKIS